jgi:hypothetical protein
MFLFIAPLLFGRKLQLFFSIGVGGYKTVFKFDNKKKKFDDKYILKLLNF